MCLCLCVYICPYIYVHTYPLFEEVVLRCVQQFIENGVEASVQALPFKRYISLSHIAVLCLCIFKEICFGITRSLLLF